MIAIVQSAPLVTGATSYKPKATLWHKDIGSEEENYLTGHFGMENTICATAST